MYTVKCELPTERQERRKENKTSTNNYGKRWKRILEKRAERIARATMLPSVRRSAIRQGSL
jgi:hypothetical protein